MTIEFFVKGEPKAQARPRAFARNFGGKWQARVYDSSSAEGWKGAIALQGKASVPLTPMVGPLCLNLWFYFTRPKKHLNSEARRKKGFPLFREDAPAWHIQKPDRDNLEKAVLDALKTLGFFEDDCQICEGEVRKLWESEGRPPGVKIYLASL